MSGTVGEAEWYYVGQYGELGPLSLEQMRDLIQDKVIGPDTYVWRRGMTDWIQADGVAELRARISQEMTTPPPPPPGSTRPAVPVAPMSQIAPAAYAPGGGGAHALHHARAIDWLAMEQSLPKSDKSRIVGGLLNLIPGIGRFYLGYSAHGALQLLTVPLCGIGLVWAWIDCLYILMGGVKYDGYGRVMQD